MGFGPYLDLSHLGPTDKPGSIQSHSSGDWRGYDPWRGGHGAAQRDS